MTLDPALAHAARMHILTRHPNTPHELIIVALASIEAVNRGRPDKAIPLPDTHKWRGHDYVLAAHAIDQYDLELFLFTDHPDAATRDIQRAQHNLTITKLDPH